MSFSLSLKTKKKKKKKELTSSYICHLFAWKSSKNAKEGESHFKGSKVLIHLFSVCVALFWLLAMNTSQRRNVYCLWLLSVPSHGTISFGDKHVHFRAMSTGGSWTTFEHTFSETNTGSGWRVQKTPQNVFPCCFRKNLRNFLYF